jgi:hypothetical protein
MAAVKSYTFVPGAVAANTPTNMPPDAPLFQRVTSVVVLTEASGGTASTTSPVEATVIYSGVPAAGQFLLTTGPNGQQQWEYGSATTAGTVFVIQGFTQGALARVS